MRKDDITNEPLTDWFPPGTNPVREGVYLTGSGVCG